MNLSAALTHTRAIKAPARFLALTGLALLQALITQPAGAAIVVAHAVTEGSATPPNSLSLGVSASVGDVIEVILFDPTGGNPGTVTASDGLNGAYTLLQSTYNSNAGSYIGVWWIRVTAAGDPTISVSETTHIYGYLTALQITGWAGTPTVDPGATASSQFTGTGSGLSQSVTAGYPNEILIASIYPQPGGYESGSWTDPSGVREVIYDVATSSGTMALPATYTTTNGSTYMMVTSGLYDAVVSGSPPQSLSLLGVGP